MDNKNKKLQDMWSRMTPEQRSAIRNGYVPQGFIEVLNKEGIVVNDLYQFSFTKDESRLKKISKSILFNLRFWKYAMNQPFWFDIKLKWCILYFLISTPIFALAIFDCSYRLFEWLMK